MLPTLFLLNPRHMTTGKTTTEETTKQYPTVPNAEGWYYSTEEEENDGILTKVDDTDYATKKFVTKEGDVVKVRELTGGETMKAKQIAGIKAKKVADPTDGDRIQYAMVELAVTINDQKIFADQVPYMKSKVLTKILGIVTELNF